MIDTTTERYEVVLTYGGAVEKQQYLARRENMDGSFSYFVLPMQYNYEGDDSNPDPEDWPWRDYRSDHWYDFGSDALRQPDDADSFDNNCAGCHFTAIASKAAMLRVGPRGRSSIPRARSTTTATAGRS